MPFEEKRHWILGLLVATMLLTVGLGLSGLSVSSGAPAYAPNALRLTPPPNVSGPLSHHSDLFVNASAPAGSFPAGQHVTADLRVSVPSYRSSGGADQVRIPNSVLQFPSTIGPLRIYLSAVNLTITATGAASGTAGPAARWAMPVAFNGSGTASMSTQGLAVMASWPYGQYPVQFAWRWVMIAVDGTPTSGVWSPWAAVTPPEIANLAVAPPQTWAVGGSTNLCMNGPVQGRTFAVHVSINNPVAQYTAATVTVPSAIGSVYCWNNSLPVGIAPQQGFVHIWEFANVTFQLYNFPVQLVASDASSSSPPVFGLMTGWGPMLIVVAVVIGAGIILALAARRARRRRGA